MKNVTPADLVQYTRGQLVCVAIVAAAWAVFYALLLTSGGKPVGQAQRHPATIVSGAPAGAELLSASRMAHPQAGHPAPR